MRKVKAICNISLKNIAVSILTIIRISTCPNLGLRLLSTRGVAVEGLGGFQLLVAMACDDTSEPAWKHAAGGPGGSMLLGSMEHERFRV